MGRRGRIPRHFFIAHLVAAGKFNLMILQTRLPYNAFEARPLPSIQLLEMDNWLHVDDAYADQMSERARLIATHGRDVLDRCPGSDDAETEALDTVLRHLPRGFDVDGRQVQCPDGRVVDVDDAPPLEILGQIIQEDVCLMRKSDDGPEHSLIAAVLCFPASWRLQEKLGRHLVGIHAPVPEYDDRLARKVQRLFDGMKSGRALWRFNALWYEDPTLYQPRSAEMPRPAQDAGSAPFFRSERQCLVQLPRSGATIFSIHTYVLDRTAALAEKQTAQAV